MPLEKKEDILENKEESIENIENENLLNQNNQKENNIFKNIKEEDLENIPSEQNDEYLKLLEEIKTKVNSEKNIDAEKDFSETIILNRSELNNAIENIDESNSSKDNEYSESVLTDGNNQENENTTFIPPFINQSTNSQNEEQKNIALELLGVKKRIGLKTIVEDITFAMHEGEIIGLLGPNGSGKTTIMRMIVGLTKISKGEIYCFEKPLGLGNTKMLTEVGSMIESPEFYNYMSGYSNLKQIARLSGKKISRSKIKELIKFVGLEKVARKKVKTYSLGMRQRLGLAQALLHDPKVLILDEPVNGLDPQGVQEFRNKLKEIAATGVSILISSHLLDEIEKVSDRVIVLEKGKIIVDEKLEKLRTTDIEKTLISTYDDDRAISLINELDIPYALTKDGFIFENLSREDKARVISYLTNSYVEIHEISVLQKTLEERFLELTSKGGNN